MRADRGSNKVMGGGSAKDPETENHTRVAVNTVEQALGWKNGWNAFDLVSLRLESCSLEALEKQYLFCALIRFQLVFFVSTRARDCTTFMLHDLTDFYTERVTAHCIKINDHLCFHKRWPKTKLQLKHLWKQGVPLVFQGPCAAYSAFREDRLWLFYLRSVREKHESYVWTTPFNYTLVS